MFKPSDLWASIPLLLFLSVPTCGGLQQMPPMPTPSPSPSSPSTLITEPLKASEHEFYYQGKPIRLLGSVICCSEGVLERGWPLVTPQALEEISAAGGNWTHIRLGPYSTETEENSAYSADGSFNPLFWSRVEEAGRAAMEKGIFLEASLIDSWALKTGNSSFGGCEILAQPPTERQREFVRKAVSVLGRFPNVLWEISNESGVPPCSRYLSKKWEEGVALTIKVAEQEGGFPSHLISTNCGSEFPELQNASYIDYLNVHEDKALSLEGKRPLANNEYAASLSPEQWANEAKQAIRNGTIFHQWRSESWGELENRRALELLKEIVNSEP